jgi:hypothetical protein
MIPVIKTTGEPGQEHWGSRDTHVTHGHTAHAECALWLSGCAPVHPTRHPTQAYPYAKVGVVSLSVDRRLCSHAAPRFT